jgi:putative salt-induced outer membrane protein YdiY
LIQPRIFSEFNLPGVQKLKPRVGLGYTFINTNLERTVQNTSLNVSDTNNGFNVNAALSYDINDSFFLQGQYDLIFNDDLGKSGKTLGILKFGLGLRF